MVLLVVVSMAALDDAADTEEPTHVAAAPRREAPSTSAAPPPPPIATTPASEQEREASPSPAPSPPAACQQPPAELVETVAEGLAMAGNGWQRDGAVATAAVVQTGGELTDAAMLVSPERPEVTFVAARIPGVDRVGLWAVGAAQSGNGLTVAVNSTAVDYSIWPASREVRAPGLIMQPVNSTVEGYDEVLACVDPAQAR